MDDNNNFVTIDTSLLVLHTDKPIMEPAYKLRGYIADQFREYPMFHNHYGNRCMFADTRIQYKVIDRVGYVLGIGEGAKYIKMIDKIKELHLENSIYKINDKTFYSKQERIAKTKELIQYDLMAPWIALNDINFEIYNKLRKSHDQLEIKLLLNSILVGNVISLCKGIGLDIKGDIYAQSRVMPIVSIYKVRRIAFIGEFRTNVEIPDFFGIGGKVSVGFGVIKRRY